jgi:predicted nucleotidyltransferase
MKNIKIKKIEGMDEKIAKRVIEKIKMKLPSEGRILVLSLTGSRAFGWGGEGYDYDVHGIFVAKNYWEYVHTGEEGFDINLWEFSQIWPLIEEQSFEAFMNFSNPFYIHPKFDYRGFMRLCTAEAVKRKRYDIEHQVREFEATKNPRAALHSYRILMVPIYFLKKKKFELNIFKINNKYYHFKEIEKLKAAYTRGEKGWNFKRVKKDLARLKKEYDRLCKKKEEKLDLEKAQKWFAKMKKIFLR